MKKVLLAISIFSLLAVVGTTASAQCDTEKYSNDCISKLQPGFTFLKSYAIDGQGGSKDKVEYSYVFTKGAQYQISICNPGSNTDGIVVKLFDSSRTQVASSYVQGSYLSGLTFPCNTTGIYYITFTFEGSSNYCGGSVLGFKR
jgi:hypothetical protein